MSKWGVLASLVIGAAAAVGAGTAAPGLSAAEHAAKPIPGPRPTAAPVVRATAQPSTTRAAAATNAASQPVEGWTVPPLAGNLGVLSTRSMFLHGRPAAAHAGPSKPAAPSLVLRGVARQGEQPMAFVEDVGANQTKQLHVGDALGTGTLVAITADGIDRMQAGKVSHVKVGQSIDAAGGGAGGPPGAPGSPIPGPTTRPTGIAQQGPTENEPSAANAPPAGATAVLDPAAPAEVSTAGAKLVPGHE
jgi:hypothetical protein